MMQLESFPNELLLELFGFFNIVQLLQAYYDLNTRLNTLLDVHMHAYKLDFRSLSKRDFDLFCQEQLPSRINRIVSISLSDDDETPDLSRYFLSYGLSSNTFINLRSLALYDVHSTNIIQKLVSDCRYLPHFTHLKVINCRFGIQKELNRFINTVWFLEQLTHCHLDDILEFGVHLITPNVSSSPIEHLSITNSIYPWNELGFLLKQTPNLRQLSISTMVITDDQRMETVHTSITKLKLSFSHSIESMENLLRMMPNLSHLTVDIKDMCLNGYQWEEIIVNYLQKIRIFRFRMIFSSENNSNDDIEEEIDLLLDTFRTWFWVDEHLWFVRCDWNTQTGDNVAVYTVPYAFDKLSIDHSTRSKWTCPDDSNYWVYNRVKQFWYQNDLFQDLTRFPARFPHIHHLRIRLPANDNFSSVIPTLSHLTSLNLSLRQSRSVAQIHALFNRIPYLYSLTIEESLFTRLATLGNLCQTIRRLNLFELSGFYFDRAKCSLLVNSSLGHQCEVLIVGVEHPIHVHYLISHMSNLRVLIFRCRGDKWHQNGSLLAKDELLDSLKTRLPCTCLISRNKQVAHKIRVWIG